MKVLVGTIAWRQLEGEYVKSVLELCRLGGTEYYLHSGDALVERARGAVAYHFLHETDADVLLSIDSDIVFSWQQAMLMCEQAMEHSIVCGLYVTRAGGARCRPACALKIGQTVTCGTDPTPVEIQWPATGFLAMHRRVFEALAKRPDGRLLHPETSMRFYPFYVPFEVEASGEPILLSEDYAIGERARLEGFPTFLNPAVRLGHIGEKVFTVMDALLPARLSQTEVSLSQVAPHKFRIVGSISQKDMAQFPALGARNAVPTPDQPVTTRGGLVLPGMRDVARVYENGGRAP